MVKPPSPSGIDWLRKLGIRNISKQVPVGHGDTHMAILSEGVINEWYLKEHSSHFRNWPLRIEVVCHCVNDGFSVYLPIQIHLRSIRKSQSLSSFSVLVLSSFSLAF